MLGSVQHGRRIWYPEKELQHVVVDCISTDGGQTRERGRLTKWRQMSARYPNDNQRQRNCRFDTEKNDTCESCRQAFSRPQNPLDAKGYRYVEVHERHRHDERAHQQGQQPHQVRKA